MAITLSPELIKQVKEFLRVNHLEAMIKDIQLIRQAKSKNIIIQLNNKKQIVFNKDYKIIAGEKNVEIYKNPFDANEVAEYEKLANKLLKENKIKDAKDIIKIVCSFENNILICSAVSTNPIFGQVTSIKFNRKKIKNFEKEICEHYFFQTLSNAKTNELKVELYNKLTEIQKNMKSYDKNFLSCISGNISNLLKTNKNIEKLTFSRNKSDFKITNPSYLSGVYKLNGDFILTDEKKLAIIYPKLPKLYKIYNDLENVLKKYDITHKYKIGTKGNQIYFKIDLNYYGKKKIVDIDWNTYLSNKNNYSKEIKNWKQETDKEEQLKQANFQNKIDNLPISKNILAKEIVKLVQKNKYITSGIICKLLKGKGNISVDINGTPECGKYSMLTTEEIADVIEQLIDDEVLTTKDVKGTYGHYDIIKPTGYSSYFLNSNFKYKKMEEYSQMQMVELVKTDLSNKSLSSWKKRLFLLDEKEILARYPEEVKKYFSNAPKEIKEYIRMKASFETGYAKKRLLNIVK